MNIAIVNDDRISNDFLRIVIERNTPHSLIWSVLNAEDAYTECERDLPDLILMDIAMPGINGAQATRHIMQTTPCAILIVADSVHAYQSHVFDALGAGAIDAVNVPDLDEGIKDDNLAPLLRKISHIERLIGTDIARNQPRTTAIRQRDNQLIAIGSSTGGPTALAHILSQLPSEFPMPIVIIQHIDQQFSRDLASWLNEQCDLKVKIATEGETPALGCVYLADSHAHLTIGKNFRFHYEKEPEDYPYRPSVDIFFNSASKNIKSRVIGLLLTGMGRDGAKGLLNLKKNGHHTIVQDKESSVVFGMPKAAVALDAANEVLHLNHIASALIELSCNHETIQKTES
ncbi:MAG: chemotaxis response regulator protein-glutamate methylesterase [Gammaproteobacteria bacterium]|nr:MAG: chemotaxis response regulator protein-glutamate methylesterase [Gammaproteobacteria bacterium]